MEEDCPICGKTCDRQGLENHIRLTNGQGHGPAGSTPDEIGGSGGDTRDSIKGVHADEVAADDPQGEGEMSVQEAIDRAFDLAVQGSERVDSRLTQLERRVDQLEASIEPMSGGDKPECPRCGAQDPNPMAGAEAEAHPDLRDSYDWVCTSCQNPFNAEA